MSGWQNEAHIDRLKEHHAAGMSFSQIADALNREFRDANYSRNSTIGKANRLGLIRAQPSAPKVLEVRSTPAPKPAKVPAPKGVMILTPNRGGSGLAKAIDAAAENAQAREQPAQNVIQMSRAFAPVQGHAPVPFGSKGCKWPVSGEGADMLCCGRPKDGERPYCASHWAVARNQNQPKDSKPRQLARSLRRYV